MSTAATLDRSLTFTRTLAPVRLPLRNLFLTFALSVVSLAVAGYLQGKAGYEMLIVAMGWPHVILGFLFYFGKVLRGEARARSSFAGLALLTLALWGAHYFYTITGFISVYFTYHVFRDEVFIYHQTRARHRLRDAVRVAGFIPFIFLMFIVTDPRPQHYRQDLRRVEFTNAQQSANGWTLFRFDSIPYSGGHDFYFYVEASREGGGLTTFASVEDANRGGEIRLSDRRWTKASDLLFLPHYADENQARPASVNLAGETMPMTLGGDYRLGQTFRAERDHLSGIWLRTGAANNAAQTAPLVFHLTPDTSLPLPPLSPLMEAVRYLLIAILAGLLLWKALPHAKSNRAFWLYFALLIGVFAVLQKTITALGVRGLDVPIMFQMVVVFHYWSWYVFSFDKLGAFKGAKAPGAQGANAASAQGANQLSTASESSAFDRLLVWLRSTKNFTLFVIGLNLLSLAGVLWFSKLDGPPALRFVFDYSYFLYFLVFHVTFSFGPKQASQKMSAPATEATVATAT